jgi:hypothetical protein
MRYFRVTRSVCPPAIVSIKFEYVYSPKTGKGATELKISPHDVSTDGWQIRDYR